MIQSILSTVVTLFILLMTIVFHELAHGYAALAMGDTTARDQGRLSLNPIKHLDPFGLLSMMFFKIGWAKPVPINPFRFRNHRVGLFVVSIAGVFVNSLLALLGIVLKMYTNPDLLVERLLIDPLIIYNVSFAVFNILPLPPLDGSKVLASFLPEGALQRFYQVEKYFYGILLIIVFIRIPGYGSLLQRILMPMIEGYLKFLFRLVGF